MSKGYKDKQQWEKKRQRIVLLHHVPYTEAEITTEPLSDSSIRICVSAIKGEDSYYITDQLFLSPLNNNIYLFPYLLNSDDSPWVDANQFLLEKAMNHADGYKSTDAIREKASQLLEYKIFCEQQSIDMMDFSFRLASQRPSYRYFRYLIDSARFNARSINKHTKVVYDFYSYLSSQLGSELDMDRVDKTTLINVHYETARGRVSHSVPKRSQTLKTPTLASQPPTGFIREFGEDLRPLNNSERVILLKALSSERFSADERLMHYIAMYTGARKQTILTLRMKHLRLFCNDNLLVNDCYKIHAGPGTGIDTKFSKSIDLYFPKQLAEKIKLYANCKSAQKRRAKFRLKFGDALSNDDMYIFLTHKGNCHYMAKDDPRYLTTKTRPGGRNTYVMKEKLLKLVPDKFPRDFTFHWLRATFALLLWQSIQPLLEQKKLNYGDAISSIQRRLHHENRETTENYLKLFCMIDDNLLAQEMYEDSLFRTLKNDFGCMA